MTQLTEYSVELKRRFVTLSRLFWAVETEYNRSFGSYSKRSLHHGYADLKTLSKVFSNYFRYRTGATEREELIARYENLVELDLAELDLASELSLVAVRDSISAMLNEANVRGGSDSFETWHRLADSFSGMVKAEKLFIAAVTRNQAQDRSRARTAGTNFE